MIWKVTEVLHSCLTIQYQCRPKIKIRVSHVDRFHDPDDALVINVYENATYRGILRTIIRKWASNYVFFLWRDDNGKRFQ